MREEFINITRIEDCPILLSELWTGLTAAAGASVGAQVGNLAPTDALGYVVHGPDTQSAAYVLTDAVSPASVNMLVAKDNAVKCEVMQQHLHKLGYVAVMSENGPDDVLLTDYKMPEMDGYELTSQLCGIEAETGQHLTVAIRITASLKLEIHDSLMYAGINDYLPKPFNLIDAV